MYRLKRNLRYRTMLPWLAAPFMILAISCVAKAEIVENVDFHYYQINPRSMSDLPRELKRSAGSPLWTGFTRWGITYWYGYVESEGVCKLNDINVRLDIRYKMPKLFQPSRDLALKREFDRYYVKLVEHEEGHADIARKAAKAVEQMLAAVSASDCKDLKGIEQQKYKSIIRQYRNNGRQYDVITNHGRDQARYREGMFDN